MSDQNDLLASAYLDGDVTAEERARVEADPALSAQVAAMRAVRAELRRVEPLAATRASDLIAHALDAPPAAAGRPPATIDAPRRAWNRWLAAAAAVVAIGAAGVVVASTLDRQSSDDADTATMAVAEDSSADDDAAAGGADVADTEAASERIEAPAVPFATEAPDELASDAGTEQTEAPVSEAEAYDTSVVLVGPEQLAAFGSEAMRQADAVPSPSPAPVCVLEPDQRSVGAVTYVAVPGGLERAVLVVVDHDAEVVTALDVTTCQPVATVPVD